MGSQCQIQIDFGLRGIQAPRVTSGALGKKTLRLEGMRRIEPACITLDDIKRECDQVALGRGFFR
jgi:hypothetical protein